MVFNSLLETVATLAPDSSLPQDIKPVIIVAATDVQVANVQSEDFDEGTNPLNEGLEIGQPGYNLLGQNFVSFNWPLHPFNFNR